MKPYVVKVNRRRENFSLYIGRAWAGLPDSKWRNPYHEHQYGRAECIRLYEQHLRGDSSLLSAIPELEGQALGCWCFPEACHGDVLVRVYKELVRPGVGDMAMPVTLHGDFMLPSPLLIEYIAKPFGTEWVKLSGQLGLIPREQVRWP